MRRLFNIYSTLELNLNKSFTEIKKKLEIFYSKTVIKMPTTTSITKLKQDSYSTFASSTMKSLSMSNGSHTRLLPDIRIYRFVFLLI